MKTIGLSRNLAHLKEKLESSGYEVTFYDEIQFPVDIFIYSKGYNEPTLYSATQMLNNIQSASNRLDYGHAGTLLIDGKNKSIEEIKYIIENRVYSPIF